MTANTFSLQNGIDLKLLSDQHIFPMEIAKGDLATHATKLESFDPKGVMQTIFAKLKVEEIKNIKEPPPPVNLS
jgi:hypothetical protein